MVGKYQVEISSKRLKYEFTIRRCITVIRGDSATGKTQLINMIRDYNDLGTESGITLRCDRECVVLEGRRWKEMLSGIRNSLVFIDEGNDFMKSQEFAEAIRGTSNYYILITREKLSMLPYSVREIYGIRERGRYPAVTPLYNELFPLYPRGGVRKQGKAEKLFTEDAGAGYDFFASAAEQNVACIAAGGKSKLLGCVIQNTRNNETVLAIADGAAFGPEMENMMEYLNLHDNVSLYVPESFEWLLLRSGIVEVASDLLEKTYDYADSNLYMSWEQYYTALLRQLTRDTILTYSKEKLNPVYLSDKNKKRILDVMKQAF